jgi:hypothetical protein
MIPSWAIFKLQITGPEMASPFLLISFGSHRLSDHFAIAGTKQPLSKYFLSVTFTFKQFKKGVYCNPYS